MNARNNNQINCKRLTLLCLLTLLGSLRLFAYNADNLVGSAFHNGVDPDYFMMYFQDGNIAAFIIGILFIVVQFACRKHISSKLRLPLIVFDLTIIVASILFMSFGIGYNGFFILILCALGVMSLSLYVLLPILLILWILK
ncbi:MAG: hypothetical protein K2K82_08920, partial [Muribaculaceae bacterium]|nr:hypothetical protein [Muribaculaceae bacterium]